VPHRVSVSSLHFSTPLFSSFFCYFFRFLSKLIALLGKRPPPPFDGPPPLIKFTGVGKTRKHIHAPPTGFCSNLEDYTVIGLLLWVIFRVFDAFVP